MLRSVAAALVSAATVLALCGPENPCPESSPCCSREYTDEFGHDGHD